MKNLRLLENCFPVEASSQDQCIKLERISSSLIRENSKLVKERDQLSMQAKKQELCISQLLKKLDEATKVSKDQQTNFDEALQRQTETLASMFQELSKSRNEIIQLRQELADEKEKQDESSSIATNNERRESLASSIPSTASQIPQNNNHNKENEDGPISGLLDDISDEDTVPIQNNGQHLDKNVMALEDEIAHLRCTMIQQENQYKETLADNQKRIFELEKENEDNKLTAIVPSSMIIDKKRSGLQEEDDEDYGSSRPPLFGKASSLGGFGFAKSLFAVGSASTASRQNSINTMYSGDDDEFMRLPPSTSDGFL